MSWSKRPGGAGIFTGADPQVRYAGMVEVNGRSAKPFAHAGRRDDRWRMMVSAEEMH